MGARQKLNQAYINGAVVLAAVAGIACQSWLVFLGAMIFAIVMNVYGGGIRTARRNRR